MSGEVVVVGGGDEFMQEQVANHFGLRKGDICIICWATIVTMCFKGTGVCCENHRKQRDGEPTDRPQAISSL